MIPKISCIMATYNRPLFARRALELFKRQTYGNKELIVLHDGPWTAIPENLGPDVRWFNFNGREGMTRKERWGMSLASGDYLTTWDDDDYYGPERLAVQAEPLIAGQADVTGFRIVTVLTVPDGRFWKWKGSIPADEQSPEYLRNVPIHDGTAMYRRRCLAGVPDSVREAAQLELLAVMQARGARFECLPNGGHFVYVRHGTNFWAFRTEERADPSTQPYWFSDDDLAFYKNPELVAPIQ